jgi:predicted phosphodiesterase
MLTAVVSDLHLGKAAGHDLLGGQAARSRLFERIAEADRLVLLGDVVELREGPIAQAMADARPFFEELGGVFAGKPIVLVGGNHDYQLAAALLERTALDGGPQTLTVDHAVTPSADQDTPTGRIAGWLADTDLTLAYPGTWIRPDVYATHGHYMDWHGTVPTIEVMAIGLAERVVGPGRGGRGRDTMTPADYEAALAPVYELAYTLAQSSSRNGRQLAGGGRSVDMWERLNSPSATGKVARGAVIPAAVGALNKLGLGPFNPDLTAVELRRAGLRSMAASITALGIDAEHVIFGHTHRSGPWPRDTEGWERPGGGRLWNSGSWVHEPAFLGPEPYDSPYFPGVVVWVGDDGPPRLERLLELGDLPGRPTR